MTWPVSPAVAWLEETFDFAMRRLQADTAVCHEFDEAIKKHWPRTLRRRNELHRQIKAQVYQEYGLPYEDEEVA